MRAEHQPRWFYPGDCDPGLSTASESTFSASSTSEGDGDYHGFPGTLEMHRA